MNIFLDIYVENLHNYQIPTDFEIKSAVLKVLNDKKLKGNFAVAIKFVDRQEIHDLNKKYRQIDAPTDVLSFPIHDKIPANIPIPILLGDIIVCPDCAEAPILELIKHSALHLLGFHHPGD